VKPTVTRFAYPWYFAALSRALGPLGRTDSVGSLAPLHMASSAFSAEGLELPDAAGRAALLGAEFDGAMELLGRGEFSPLGRIHWRAVLVSAARARIRYERYIAGGRPVGPVREPLFVIGLPRTGTSLVQRLIAEDPSRRGLMTYELLSPIPPERSSRWSEAKRVGYGRLSSLVYKAFTPELIQIHYTAPRSLEECWLLFMPSYAVLNADYIFPETAFGDWLLGEAPMRAAYERYRSQLGILGLESPDRSFVLKSPEHLWFLDTLLDVFPDARVIWTHRDPVEAVPSYAAQMSLPTRQHRGRVDPTAIGQRVLHRFQQGVERGLSVCAARPSARIVHLRYPELIADPAGAVRRAYGELGLEVSPEHERRMSEFLGRPQPDRGRNHTRLGDFGLTREELGEHFRAYTERFQLARA
jgi:hypothetical protein